MRAARPKVLFICGSINQTTQMHAVARELDDVEAWFTPFYGDATTQIIRKLGLAEATIGGKKRRGWCLEYLRDHSLAVDEDGKRGGYALVVTCSDLTVPKNARASKLVLVQEGILDPMGRVARLCKRFPRIFPRWLAGTALNGQSFLWDRFCVASEGYRRFFVGQGADPARVVATGIPNFDDCARFLANDFPHHGYVLVCTSDARETYQRDDRAAFVRRAVAIARGRQLVFKLHPNENHARATREILAIVPSALVYARGAVEPMIANSEVVVTQWSSTAFVALALGKELHSNASVEELRALLPVQNGGTSGKNIARVCRELLGARGRGRTIETPASRELVELARREVSA